MRRALIALCLAFSLAGAAHAGRTCEGKALTEAATRQSLNLAMSTQQALNASGASVVVLGRIGQDLSAYKQRFSHVGIAYKATPEGAWRVVHKLNDCGTSDAGVYEQGLAEFFLDDMFRFEAGFVALSKDAQAQVQGWLASGRLLAMHERAYSMVAYPWNTRYQQSNQWALESLMLAFKPETQSRAQAQAALQADGYSPVVLNLSTGTRLGARMFRANVAFDDHPNEKRFAGRIETTSADSVFAYLQARSYAGALQVVR
jgi:hypothetical protein